MAKVIIEDEYVRNVGMKVREELEKTGKTLSTYITLLEEVRKKGLMKGSTAEALGEFISLAEHLKGTFWDIGGCVGVDCENYIDEVDDADKYLY